MMFGDVPNPSLAAYQVGGASSFPSSNLVFNSRFFFGLGLGAGM